MATTNIKSLPISERPREKLLTSGAESLSDAELLAVLFGSGTRGKNAVDVARIILAQHQQSLPNLLATNKTDFCKIPGLGDARYVLLQAALEMGRRVLSAKIERGDQIGGPEAAENFLKEQLAHYKYEVFAVLFLDKRHRVLSFEHLFRGTIDGATVHAREVVRRVLHHNAAAVIFAHNHPSGVAEPSQPDMQITKRLVEIMGLMDVTVLDHVVVGANNTCSMAAFGYL